MPALLTVADLSTVALYFDQIILPIVSDEEVWAVRHTELLHRAAELSQIVNDMLLVVVSFRCASHWLLLRYSFNRIQLSILMMAHQINILSTSVRVENAASGFNLLVGSPSGNRSPGKSGRSGIVRLPERALVRTVVGSSKTVLGSQPETRSSHFDAAPNSVRAMGPLQEQNALEQRR
jgi:hypothetical protein